MEAIHWRFESNQIGSFIRNCACEVESANALTAGDLKNSIQLMRDGVLAIPRVPNAVVVPAPVAQPAAVAAEPVKAVFHRVDRPSYQMKFAARG
jgi:hypothetical protein